MLVCFTSRSSKLIINARLLLSTHVNLPTSTLCLVLASSPTKFSTYGNVTDEKTDKENFMHPSVHSLRTRKIRPWDKASQVYNELCGNASMLSAGAEAVLIILRYVYNRCYSFIT